MGGGGRKEKLEPVLALRWLSGVPGMVIWLVGGAVKGKGKEGELRLEGWGGRGGGVGGRGEEGRGIIRPFVNSTRWSS